SDKSGRFAAGLGRARAPALAQGSRRNKKLATFGQMRTLHMSVDVFRQQCALQPLRETEIDPNPFGQFRRWFDQALAAQLPEPHAMTLATVTPEGKPAARVVLLRGFDASGFVFYTNYDSRKGQELAAHPWAALVLFWVELHRQIRIEGRVEQVI